MFRLGYNVRSSMDAVAVCFTLALQVARSCSLSHASRSKRCATSVLSSPLFPPLCAYARPAVCLEQAEEGGSITRGDDGRRPDTESWAQILSRSSERVGAAVQYRRVPQQASRDAILLRTCKSTEVHRRIPCCVRTRGPDVEHSEDPEQGVRQLLCCLYIAQYLKQALWQCNIGAASRLILFSRWRSRLQATAGGIAFVFSDRTIYM